MVRRNMLEASRDMADGAFILDIFLGVGWSGDCVSVGVGVGVGVALWGC